MRSPPYALLKIFISKTLNKGKKFHHKKIGWLLIETILSSHLPGALMSK